MQESPGPFDADAAAALIILTGCGSTSSQTSDVTSSARKSLGNWGHSGLGKNYSMRARSCGY